ncbi:MAG: hypothetical protein K0S28_1596 [Paucimonas sp.]|nr:hypothetical protein [Paucimonas sp.]
MPGTTPSKQARIESGIDQEFVEAQRRKLAHEGIAVGIHNAKVAILDAGHASVLALELHRAVRGRLAEYHRNSAIVTNVCQHLYSLGGGDEYGHF